MKIRHAVPAAGFDGGVSQNGVGPQEFMGGKQENAGSPFKNA